MNLYILTRSRLFPPHWTGVSAPSGEARGLRCSGDTLDMGSP